MIYAPGPPPSSLRVLDTPGGGPYHPNMLSNGPRSFPLDFGDADPVDFTKLASQAGLDRKRLYHNLPAYGACTRCKETGSVDVPLDFDPAETDKMIAGRIVKVYCERCRDTVEFRPLTPAELSENQFYLMRRNYEIYKKQKLDGRELPPLIQEFVDEYEKRLQSALKLQGLGAAAPHIPSARPEGNEQKPRIITDV